MFFKVYSHLQAVMVCNYFTNFAPVSELSSSCTNNFGQLIRRCVPERLSKGLGHDSEVESNFVDCPSLLGLNENLRRFLNFITIFSAVQVKTYLKTFEQFFSTPVFFINFFLYLSVI
jgi:hypothetical protein